MTVSSPTSRSGPYNGNGVTTVFARDFLVINADHLKVYQTIDNVVSEVTTGITKDGIGMASGNVTFDTAPASGTQIELVRETPLLQQSDYVSQAKVDPEVIENDLDLSVMRDQDLNSRVALTEEALAGVAQDIIDVENARDLAVSSAAAAAEDAEQVATAVDDLVGLSNDQLITGTKSFTQETKFTRGSGRDVLAESTFPGFGWKDTSANAGAQSVRVIYSDGEWLLQHRADDWSAAVSNMYGIFNNAGGPHTHRWYLQNAITMQLNASVLDIDVPVLLASDPSEDLHAATKQYVDNSFDSLAVNPDNALVAAFFKDTDNVEVDFYSTVDGIDFNLLNSASLPRDGDAFVASRDPSIIWYNGEWWLFVTNVLPGTHDFVVYKSKHLQGSWRRFNCTLGPTVIASTTTPFPGGTVPAEEIWGPDPFVSDGKLYVAASVRYDANVSGKKHFRTVICELNSQSSVTWNAPTLISTGADDAKSLIDTHFRKYDSTWYMIQKDNVADTVRIYTSSTLSGPYAFDQELSESGESVEAVHLCHIYERQQSDGALNQKIRIYVDNYQAGTERVEGRTGYFEADGANPSAPFGSLQYCTFDHPVRHGSVINLVDLPDTARNIADVSALAAFGGPGTVEGRTDYELADGNDTIYPVPNGLYFVDGSSDCQLTIFDGPADRFYLAAFTATATAGISVQNAGRIPTAFKLGYGQTNDMILEVKRKPNGQYAPVGYPDAPNIMRKQSHTIASGVIDIGLAEWIVVDTEGSAATDTLTRINGGVVGQKIWLTTADSSRDVTIESDAPGGNIQLTDSTDQTLAQVRDGIALYYDGLQWREQSRNI